MTCTHVACPDDPRHVHSDLMCLYAVSKELRGELVLEESEVEECEERWPAAVEGPRVGVHRRQRRQPAASTLRRSSGRAQA